MRWTIQLRDLRILACFMWAVGGPLFALKYWFPAGVLLLIAVMNVAFDLNGSLRGYPDESPTTEG